ncbi:hypothetical protein F2P45_21440 [Massilia sp. CCM 8733]|uniref:Secreted protein n=1 Tax=Massilia mucilaginosa TaxID=2609282 RepID=A0ABX0NXX8_9BURK|nr:hypothetical protein [Massilia mucilaginosa]NHZ91550.1 hypothetical protein [Massilia mucilaginosa]
MLSKQNILLAALSGAVFSSHADAAELTPAVLDFGKSVVSLVVVTAKTPEPGNGNQYVELANKLEHQILTARAAGAVTSANANMVAAALTTYAAVSPEPITKVVAAAGAWAANEQGKFIADTVIKSAEAQSVKVLKKFLDDQQVSPQQLASMSADEFVKFSRTLQSGNQTLSEALADVPGAQIALEASARDFIGQGTAAVFLQVGEVKDSVKELKQGLGNTVKAVEDLKRIAVDTSKSLVELRDITVDLRKGIQSLQGDVSANTASIRGLIEVSSMSWTPQQKLSAVNSGLFKDIVGADKDKLIAVLTKEIRRDALVGELSLRGRQLGQLAGIASDLGVDPKVVDAMVKGQQIAGAAVAFVSGDYLSAASAVVSMFGGGKPDAGATRHAEMMKYLGEQFAKVNLKLDEIKKLQEETLKETIALRQDVMELRQAMDAGFRRIEDQIYLSQELSRKIIREKWESCDNVLVPLLGYPVIKSAYDLKTLLSVNERDNLATCYTEAKKHFTHWSDPDQWPSSIIDFSVFSLSLPSTDTAQLGNARMYADTARQIFTETRNFVIAAMPRDRMLSQLGRFALPATFANHTENLELTSHSAFASDDCTAGPVDALPPLLRLACPQYDSSTGRPDANRLPNILAPTLIGPMAPKTIELGLLMSDMADLLHKQNGETDFDFMNSDDIDTLMRGQLSKRGRSSLDQQKGLHLLKAIDRFSLNWLIQQSVIFGDHTAYLVTEVLYDTESNALFVKDPGPDMKAEKRAFIVGALNAMKANSSLARNVVLLGLRKSLRQRYGKLPVVNYEIGWKGLLEPAACRGSGAFAERLNNLLQPSKPSLSANWSFRRIATPAEAGKGAAYEGCPVDDSADKRAGTGVAVQFDGFHVRLPNPKQLEQGNLEQPASLRQAIFYRNKVTQALVARNLLSTAKGIVDPAGLLQLSR